MFSGFKKKPNHSIVGIKEKMDDDKIFYDPKDKQENKMNRYESYNHYDYKSIPSQSKTPQIAKDSLIKLQNLPNVNFSNFYIFY